VINWILIDVCYLHWQNSMFVGYYLDTLKSHNSIVYLRTA
jgi:hypothetical protein